MKKISVIIKSLNEEENIAKAIESALKAIKDLNGEVVLVDSISNDNTVKVAKKYPIKIVQLKNPKDSSCGAGAQVGYLHTKGEYIYILDGDMELNKDFIKKGVKELVNDEMLAGVGGGIEEMTNENIVFKRRVKKGTSIVSKAKYVDKLMMGGLYKRKAIEKVGYFSNPYLHSYEESDLGHRLTNKNFKLKRIPINMIKHYGDRTSSLKIFLNRWRSKYLWGCGEFLRYNIGSPTQWDVIKELKLYISVMLWWLILLISIISYNSYPIILNLQLLLTIIFLIIFLLKKRSIIEFLFSIFSWNITTLGLIFGFLSKPRDINRKLGARILK